MSEHTQESDGPFCPCTGCGKREAIWLSRNPGQHLCHICDHRRLVRNASVMRDAALSERLAIDRALSMLVGVRDSSAPNSVMVAREILQGQVTSGVLSTALRGTEPFRESPPEELIERAVKKALAEQGESEEPSAKDYIIAVALSAGAILACVVLIAVSWRLLDLIKGP